MRTKTSILIITATLIAATSCGCRQSAAERAAEAAQSEWKSMEVETLQQYYEMAVPGAKAAGIDLPAPDADFLMLLDGEDFNQAVARTRDTYNRFIP